MVNMREVGALLRPPLLQEREDWPEVSTMVVEQICQAEAPAGGGAGMRGRGPTDSRGYRRGETAGVS
jgi:hypothetical protein